MRSDPTRPVAPLPECQQPMNPSPTPPAVPDSDLVTRTFGEPQWHADGDLVALAYAPDGTLWSVEEPGVLRHWEPSGKLLGRYFLSDMETLWVFGPRAELVASGSNEVVVWEVASRRQVASLPQSSWVTAIAFHPMSRVIATGHDDGAVRIWDLDSKNQRHELRHHTTAISALRFNADGSLLAVAGTDRVIHVWDPWHGELVAGKGSQAGHTIDLSPAIGTSLLVSNGAQATLQVWDLVSGSPRPPAGSVAKPLAVACSPDGRWIAFTSANPDSRLHLWDNKTRQLRPPIEGPRAPITDLTFSPDSQTLASCCRTDGTAWLW